VAGLIEKAAPDAKTENSDYVFLNFVVNYLPTGIVGLLLAVIFSAAMSSTAAELNALASTTTVDLYKRNRRAEQTDKHLLQASRIFTVLFGGLAITFALTASLFENLIEAINILGSLFYGTILGIFLVAFFIRNVGANATFIAALLAESLVLALYYTSDIGYLWFNFIGCTAVTVLSLLIQYLGLRSHERFPQIHPGQCPGFCLSQHCTEHLCPYYRPDQRWQYHVSCGGLPADRQGHC
jgi:Na+/proline symporter